MTLPAMLIIGSNWVFFVCLFRNWENDEINFKWHLVQRTELWPWHDKMPWYRSAVSVACVYRWINWDDTTLTFMLWLLSLTTNTYVSHVKVHRFTINNREQSMSPSWSKWGLLSMCPVIYSYGDRGTVDESMVYDLQMTGVTWYTGPGH